MRIIQQRRTRQIVSGRRRALAIAWYRCLKVPVLGTSTEHCTGAAPPLARTTTTSTATVLLTGSGSVRYICACNTVRLGSKMIGWACFASLGSDADRANRLQHTAEQTDVLSKRISERVVATDALDAGAGASCWCAASRRSHLGMQRKEHRTMGSKLTDLWAQVGQTSVLLYSPWKWSTITESLLAR